MALEYKKSAFIDIAKENHVQNFKWFTMMPGQHTELQIKLKTAKSTD